MRILVTGGFGFIGSNFIHSFLEHEDVELIVNIDNCSDYSDVSNVPRSPKLRNYTLDINSTNILNLLKNYQITHVLHLADNTNNVYNVIESNVVNLVRLLNNCVEHGYLKRFHSLSSLSYNELYSASKLACVNILNSYFNEYHLPITTSVCGQVYGVRQHEIKLLPSLIKQITNNTNVICKQYNHNWVYVTDVCNALWEALRESNLTGTRVIKSVYDLSEYEVACKIKEFTNSTSDIVCDVKPPKYHPFSSSHSIISTTSNFDDNLKETINFYSSSF